MQISDLLVIGALTVFSTLSVAYLISLAIRNAAIVDLFWGFGFMVLALALQFAIEPEYSNAFVFVFTLVVIWGARLCMHLAARFDPAKEDWRYARFREDWSGFVWQSYFRIFMLQAFLMLIIGLPLITTAAGGSVHVAVLIVGLLIWLAGFIFETVADSQLSSFVKTKKKDQFITKGLWKYSRHPNYFGEITMWWGIYIIAAPSGWWWLSLLSPLLITFLITKISGVPLLEKRWQGNKGYAKYAKRTNKLIPWFPRG